MYIVYNLCQKLSNGILSRNKKIIKQASDAGVSPQCLDDKMSKGARNVYIKPFLIIFTHLGPVIKNL